MLELKHVKASYNRIVALQDVSLQLSEGEIVSIVGSNGAGKTTSLMSVSGVVPCEGGDILWCGSSIKNQSPFAIVRLGIIHVPEGRRIFPEFTVFDNLILGAYCRQDRAGIQEDIGKMYQYFPILKERKQQKAGTLSGGEQQMLAIARGLMGRPKVLLLDEPSLGLAPLLVKEIFTIIKKINHSEGMSILLVEQNANLALKISNRAYVMENGFVTLSGSGKDLLNNEAVKAAYLGIS